MNTKCVICVFDKLIGCERPPVQHDWFITICSLCNNAKLQVTKELSMIACCNDIAERTNIIYFHRDRATCSSCQWITILHQLWNRFEIFSQSATVSLPCSVHIFKFVLQLKWTFWTNEISLELSLMWVSSKYFTFHKLHWRSFTCLYLHLKCIISRFCHLPKSYVVLINANSKCHSLYA